MPRDRVQTELIPSTFLPHLPRSTSTFSPLRTPDLLSHIAVLRELYLPPIHGGFTPADTSLDERPSARREDRERRSKQRERRFSAGLVETMDGLGLGLELDPNGPPLAPNPGGLESGESMLHDVLEEPDSGSEYDSEDDESEDPGDDEGPSAHLDPFEREWSQKWLSGVVRRAQTILEELEGEEDAEGGSVALLKQIEAVLRDATAVLAMMAGTSAAGSLTRHLLFPINPSLAPGLRAIRAEIPPNPNLSPETTTFLASLSVSPTSPLTSFRRPPNPSHSPEARSRSMRSGTLSSRGGGEQSTSPTASFGTSLSPSRKLERRGRGRRAAVPILLHDAPMSDHLSVGVQTWGSAILLGREMALRPSDFGLSNTPHARPVRVLELGAGTGLLSILCRKLLDLEHASASSPTRSSSHSGTWNGASPGLVVATDFLPSVLDNLKICVDLNFPPVVAGDLGVESGTDKTPTSGIHIAKLDWTTFPSWAARRAAATAAAAPTSAGVHSDQSSSGGLGNDDDRATEQTSRFMDEPFDLVLASDCVYDETHAAMLRQVAGWVLRLPDPNIQGDVGGTFHILSPLRPTFAPELQSIDTNFPTLTSYPPLPLRQAALNGAGEAGSVPTPLELKGEGLGAARGLKLGARGEGKRGVKGRKGEGRVDENQGYWWWEVGWG